MKKLILFSFLLISSVVGFSQVEEEIEEPPVMMEEAPEPVRSNNRYNNSYNTRTSPLYKEFQWIHTRYQSGSTQKYGVLKNGKPFLPMIFKKGYGQNGTGNIILGLDNSLGVYSLELEKWTIPISYKTLKPLQNNYFIARRGSIYGLIDANNNTLLPFEFASLSAIRNLENYVIASKSQGGNSYNLRYGIYSIIQGKWTTQPIYRQLRVMNNENYFTVQNEATQYNIVDVNGNLKFKKWYQKLIISKRRNHYIVELDGKMGIIDDSEKVIVPIEYQYIADRAYNDGSHLARNKDGKYGCISVDGRVTLPFEYDNIEMQNYNNIGITTQNNKCGILQVNNGLPYEITTCDYDGIEKGQTAFVIEQNGLFGLMDLYGQLQSKIEFESLRALSKLMYLAEKKDDFYLMNNKGEVLSSKGYQAIEPLYRPQRSRYGSQSNFSYFKVQLKNKKYGAIDQTGALMPIPTFDDITGEINNNFIVKNNGKIGLYSIVKKELIVPCEYDYITPTSGTFYGFKGNNVYSIRYADRAIIEQLK